MPSHQHQADKRAVCFSLPPFPTESARGYIARVADYNLHEGHADALSFAGLDLKDVMAGRVDAGSLDRIYGLETADVSQLWPQSLGGTGAARVSVYGAELSSRFFRHHLRRVSVAGLRKSLHHRHAWAIEPLGFCPESWDVLIERCPDCGHKLAWSNGAFWCCDACGIDLRRCRSVRIQREHRPALAVLSDLFSTNVGIRDAACNKLPGFLRSASLRTKVEFIRHVGRLFDRLGPEPSETPARGFSYPKVMWVGLDVLLRLDHHSAALAKPSGQARASQSNLRARLRSLTSTGTELGDAFGALSAILMPRHAPHPEVQAVRLGVAARQLRVGNAGVRQLVDLGLLPSCSTLGGGMRQHDLIAREAVDKLKAQLSSRVALKNLCAKTRVDVKIIVGLEQAGYLRTVDNEITRLLFKGVQLHLSAVDELAALTRKMQRRDARDPECIRLTHLFAAMGTGFKPWSQVILAAVAVGQLGSPEPGVMRKTTLNVSRDWVDQMGHANWTCEPEINAESISLVDAEEYLNTLSKDTSCLIAHGQLKRGEAGVTAQSVRHCARLFISTREVAARAGIESDQVAGLAARAGVERSYRFVSFWPRDRIEAAFELPPPGWAAVVSRARSMAPE
jgi:hypothetical protein